jgi:type IV pilus assembly protein PilB
MASFGAAYIDLSEVQFTPELLRLIPAKMVRKYQVLPVFEMPDRVGIATADPTDLNAIDDLVHFLDRTVELLITDKTQLKTFIERLYPNSAT